MEPKVYACLIYHIHFFNLASPRAEHWAPPKSFYYVTSLFYLEIEMINPYVIIYVYVQLNLILTYLELNHEDNIHTDRYTSKT